MTISVLPFADDIAIMSGSAEGLQSQLKVLYEWCTKWGMKVNTDKTKIVHFQNQSVPKTQLTFMFDAKDVGCVHQYKYLGLLFTEHLDYNLTAKYVAKAASRALGLLISKAKAHGDHPCDTFTKLYTSLVQPVIDCGAALWGTKTYTGISAVQYRACRFFLEVGCYTPNAGVEGDMGWTNPLHQTLMAVGDSQGHCHRILPSKFFVQYFIIKNNITL